VCFGNVAAGSTDRKIGPICSIKGKDDTGTFMTNDKINYSFLNHKKLPLVVQPQDKADSHYSALIHFLKKDNTFIKEQLLQYSAILFRGFHIDSPDKFLEAINACALGPLFNYDLCAVPRTKIREGIYTSINCHQSYTIPMHNEKSYDPEFPSHIYFNCITVPETGGTTPLVNGHQLWNSLPESLQHKLQSKGILYRRYYYGNGIKQKWVKAIGKGIHPTTWMSAFGSEDKEEVESVLRKMELQFRWIKRGDALITERLLPAVRYHPVTGTIVWFNQSDHNNYYYNGRAETIRLFIKNPITRFFMLRKSLFPYISFYGDGGLISKQDSDLMNLAIKKNMVTNPWQQGDFLVVDNYSCLHGKIPHTGDRLILAGMTG
jgi:alpha-ketoglutarate-dependent taurine dioxygenase